MPRGSGNPQNVFHGHYRDTSPSGSVDGAEDEEDAAVDIFPSDSELLPSYHNNQQMLQAKKYLPAWLVALSSGIARWTKGPQPPRPYKIEPFFPSIQKFPLRLLDRFFPKRKHKICLLIAHHMFWLLALILLLRESAFSADVKDYGAPLTLSCTATLWGNKNSCGLDGNNCRPFDNKTIAIRCPANCERVEALIPHAVGDQEVIYKPLVVGGPVDDDDDDEGNSKSVYRGDSFICSSAIHAGFVNNEMGGCGAMSLLGRETSYPSVSQNGISSIGFDSYFPQSFSFVDGSQAECRDLRWPLLGISLFFTITLSLFTTEPSVFFFPTFIGLFLHAGLVSDPPELADYHELVSMLIRRLLPSMFVAFVLYKFFIRRTLNNLEAQIEKTVLWLGGAWVGTLNNYTFDKIPIQRLTPHDLKQPGAVTALVIISLVLLFIALGQAHCLRMEGRMPRFLALYVLIGVSLGVLAAIPEMNLRIHHYILGLLLLPGTSMQTRPSFLYQGLLVGLFINGIARWGYDSLLQTPAQLFQGDQQGTPLPDIQEPIINVGAAGAAANITFFWEEIPTDWDGISVLVNDVERYRGYSDRGDAETFTWERQVEGLPEYFRFAYMAGNEAGDFTKAGVWQADGDWIHMDSGPSIKSSMHGDMSWLRNRVIYG